MFLEPQKEVEGSIGVEKFQLKLLIVCTIPVSFELLAASCPHSLGTRLTCLLIVL